MAGEIKSNREAIESAAYDVYEAAYGFTQDGSAPEGSSSGEGFDALIELSQRLHPLMASVARLTQAESDAATDMARTLEAADQAASQAIGGAQ